jgi:hypothetical protein
MTCLGGFKKAVSIAVLIGVVLATSNLAMLSSVKISESQPLMKFNETLSASDENTKRPSEEQKNFTDERKIVASSSSYNSDDARPRNLHVAFLGDSITRFQYMTFVFYLHHGRHLADRDRPNPLRDSPLIENAVGEKVFNFSNVILSPNEQCDCYRIAKWQPDLVFDNRYYIDASRNNSVSFILKYGSMNVQGHWSPSTVHDTHTLEFEYEKPRWEGNWTAAIHHLAQLTPPPKYLVFNAGIHPHDLNDPMVRLSIQQALDETGIIGIFKLTTFGRNGLENGRRWKYHEAAMCEMLKGRCIDYTWTRNLTRANFLDHIHLYVYLHSFRPPEKNPSTLRLFHPPPETGKVPPINA